MQAFVNSFFGSSGGEVEVVENERSAEEREFIKSGNRNTIVFQCSQRLPNVVATTVYSDKPLPLSSQEFIEEPKYIHLQLYEGILQVYGEREKISMNLTDITELTRGADQTIHFRCTSNSSPSLCYRFHASQSADSFQEYIEYWQDSGSVIKKTFDMIDQQKQGYISHNSLIEAMYQQGIVDVLSDTQDPAVTVPICYSTEDIIRQMMSLATPTSNEKRTNTTTSTNSDIQDVTSTFDYTDYFHVFFKIPMHSLYGCLAEWKALACAHAQAHLETQSNAHASTQLRTQQYPVATRHMSHSETTPPFTLLPGETVANIIHHAKWYLGGTAATVASSMRTLANTYRNTDSSNSTYPDQQNITSIFPKEGLFSPPFLFGTIVITNYRALLLAKDRTHGRFGIPPYFNRMVIPLTCMAQVTLTSLSSQLVFRYVLDSDKWLQRSFQVQTKDLRTILVVLPKQSPEGVQTVVHLLQQLCFPVIREHLFAYKFSPIFSVDAWPLSDIRLDYSRMLLHRSPDWQIFDNSSFDLADSYPPFLVLPACMSASNITEAAKHRSCQRLPVVTYRDHASGSCLLRSAQPLVGLTQQSSVLDEKLLNACRLSSGLIPEAEANVEVKAETCRKDSSSAALEEEGNSFTTPSSSSSISRQLYILDARWEMVTVINSIMGKVACLTLQRHGATVCVFKLDHQCYTVQCPLGTEDVTRYPSTHMEFCDISNIHVMRSSFAVLQAIVTPSILGGTIDSLFYSKLSVSKWLHHTRQILLAAVNAAEKLRMHRAAVLIHCSDGWDRTAQICLLTELILDPYYRTIRGFCLLIEKEFCTFGYKFQDRCGYAKTMDSLPYERSPVFLQALDATYQILRQYPRHFEFSSELLLFIADHVHSGLFGNFLGNSEKERLEFLHVRDSTKSIWSYVLSNPTPFLQANYQSYAGAVWPQTDIQQLHLWERYFCRWNVSSHPRSIEGSRDGVPGWCDDWGDGIP